jgi:hypothetical protein
MEARGEPNFVGLYEVERYAGELVCGADDAMVCGIEVKLDIIADFRLSHIWNESMTALLLISLCFPWTTT